MRDAWSAAWTVVLTQPLAGGSTPVAATAAVATQHHSSRVRRLGCSGSSRVAVNQGWVAVTGLKSEQVMVAISDLEAVADSGRVAVTEASGGKQAAELGEEWAPD